MVMQEVNHQLFTETVLDEVLISMEEENQEWAEEILAKLDLTGFKDRHPMSLSGGQKQRLSLARALADNPSILIMDDTTSAVDMETEAEIQRHLRELDEQKTIVTIAHRISSVKDSDLILVLEHGRIVERGTHDELVAAHGRYWEIYYRQLGLQAGRSQGFEA